MTAAGDEMKLVVAALEERKRGIAEKAVTLEASAREVALHQGRPNKAQLRKLPVSYIDTRGRIWYDAVTASRSENPYSELGAFIDSLRSDQPADARVFWVALPANCKPSEYPEPGERVATHSGRTTYDIYKAINPTGRGGRGTCTVVCLPVRIPAPPPSPSPSSSLASSDNM